MLLRSTRRARYPTRDSFRGVLHMTYGHDTIYLDHAATTPVDPGVVQSMLPFFTEHFGNPSSLYRIGQDGRAALDRARQRCAAVLGCKTSEVVFTSGASESLNLAIRGVVARWADLHPDTKPRVVSTAVEHHAVLHTLEQLEGQGVTVTLVMPDAEGLVTPHAIEDVLEDDVALVAVQYANNEIGTIQPIAEIGKLCRERGVPFLTDAVQAAGSLPLGVDALNVDMLALSAHKFYGPKGVGLLYVRKGTPIVWQQLGGGQESGRRGGTENVPLIVGMGQALAQADQMRDTANAFCTDLRNYLWNLIQGRIVGVQINGPHPGEHRLANNLNISIDGVQGETVLLSLDVMGVAASAGSACTTGNSEPSHVLRACGLIDDDVRASLRLTVGRGNSMDEMEQTATNLAEVVGRVRQLSGSSR